MRTSWNTVASALILTALVGAFATSATGVLGQGAPPGLAQERQRPLPSERIEPRLAYLKTALKITPEQEPQWSALADVLRRHAQDRDADIQQRRARQTQAQAQPPTAIERLQQRQQMLARASSRMDELVAAAQPLYASFSDDQKKIADELLDRGGRRRWH